MTEKMQADGAGSSRRGDPTGAGEDGAGGSGGGACPNPHAGTEGENADEAPEDFLGHGGRSEMRYHGPGQLGDRKVDEGEA